MTNETKENKEPDLWKKECKLLDCYEERKNLHKTIINSYR